MSTEPGGFKTHRDIIGRRFGTADGQYAPARMEATSGRRAAQRHTALEHRHHRLDQLVPRRAVAIPRRDTSRPHWLAEIHLPCWLLDRTAQPNDQGLSC